MTKKIKILSIIILICLTTVLSSCASVGVKFNSDGSGTAVVTVSKSEGVTVESVKAVADSVANGVKEQSTMERVTIKSVTDGGDCIIVKVSFKRIDATKGLGLFRFMSGADFGGQTAERNYFNKAANGDFSKGFINWNQSRFIIDKDEKIAVNPVTVSGEKIATSSFKEANNEYYDKNNIFFTYAICGFENVTSIEITFPGKVFFTGDRNVSVDKNNKVTLMPEKVTATEEYLEEDGINYGTRTGEYSAFLGFVVFRQQKNLGPIIALCTILVLTIGLILTGIFTGAFKKFFRSKTFGKIKKNKVLYLFVLPGFVLFALFNYAPMVGIIVAFKNYTVDGGIFGSEWASMGGFQHFYTMFTHPGSEFFLIFRNTIVMALLKFIFGFPAAIILALMFNALRNGFFKKSVQTISYLPYFVSWVVVSNIVYLLLSTNGGLVNNLLIALGHEKIRFYSEPKYWWGILTTTSVWKTVGWGSIIYLAAITAINPDLYEAAAIDGAGSWQKLWTVTLPGMMPVIGIQLILNAGNLIKDDFDQIYSLVGGSNYELREVTEVFSSLVYRNLQGGPKGFSSSTAISLVQSIISLILVLVANAIVKRTDNQGLW